MKHILKLLSLPCALLFLQACANDNETKVSSFATSMTPPSYSLSMNGDTTTYIDTTLFKTETGKAVQENEYITKITIAYPKVEKSKNTLPKETLNKFIQSLLLLDESGTLAYNSLEERMTDFINDYQTSKNEFFELTGFDLKWSSEISLQVLLNTPNLLSFKFEEVSFTGGNHANHATRFFNFDINTGKRLYYSDIFLPNTNTEKRDKIIYSFFRASLLKKEDVSIEEIDDNGTFQTLPPNFGLTKTGILFSFDPYEIGSFSEGTIQFEVPYYDLLPYINKSIIY